MLTWDLFRNWFSELREINVVAIAWLIDVLLCEIIDQNNSFKVSSFVLLLERRKNM